MGEHWLLLVIVVAVALIFLGPKRLPEAGKSLGQAIRGFRDETKGLRDGLAPIKDDVVSIKSEITGAHESVKASVKDAVTGNSTPSG